MYLLNICMNILVLIEVERKEVFRLSQKNLCLSHENLHISNSCLLLLEFMLLVALSKFMLLFLSDPYVKVEMYINGIREAKHKTKVRQNTQDPVWNQPCVFDINRENPKLLGHVFVFHIIHKDMMMGVQKIGQVSLKRISLTMFNIVLQNIVIKHKLV